MNAASFLHALCLGTQVLVSFPHEALILISNCSRGTLGVAERVQLRTFQSL